MTDKRLPQPGLKLEEFQNVPPWVINGGWQVATGPQPLEVRVLNLTALANGETVFLGGQRRQPVHFDPYRETFLAMPMRAIDQLLWLQHRETTSQEEFDRIMEIFGEPEDASLFDEEEFAGDGGSSELERLSLLVASAVIGSQSKDCAPAERALKDVRVFTLNIIAARALLLGNERGWWQRGLEAYQELRWKRAAILGHRARLRAEAKEE